MFSAALEMVLGVALREALARRHGHLTVEHLLYALANHPAGEEILRACAVDVERLRADLARYLEESLERRRTAALHPELGIGRALLRRTAEAAVLEVLHNGDHVHQVDHRVGRVRVELTRVGARQPAHAQRGSAYLLGRRVSRGAAAHGTLRRRRPRAR